MAGDRINLVSSWVRQRISDANSRWLDEQLEKIGDGSGDRDVYVTLGMIPRRLGKDDLKLADAEMAAAAAACPGWDPSQWSVDVAARLVVLLTLEAELGGDFKAKFVDLCRTADVGEKIALYSGLPLYASNETLVDQVIEGLRTNVRAEFEAIAHRNPFPKDHFSENAWNNMVLKALFIGVMLDPIQGIDARANPELARILHDYAHERWAAARPVQAELWRCVGPFADDVLLDDLERLIETGNAIERKAAGLALRDAPPSDKSKALIGRLAESDDPATPADYGWTALAAEMLANSLAITRKMNTELELER